MLSEQEANDRLEELCGGIEPAFRLMRLWTAAEQTVSGDRYTLSPPKRTATTVFRKLAKREGYSDAAIQAFLDLP